MRTKQLVKAGKLKFEGWLQPRFQAHNVALEKAGKSSALLQRVKHYGGIIDKFEVDMVLAFIAALRYLTIIVIVLYCWNSLKY